MGQRSAALDHHALEVKVDGMYSTRKPVTSVLGPVLFNVVIDGMEEVTGYTLIRLADSTKLGGPVNMLKGKAAFQRDLGMLKEQPNRNQALHSGVWWEDERQRAQTETNRM